jgi:hypothetical protein
VAEVVVMLQVMEQVAQEVQAVVVHKVQDHLLAVQELLIKVMQVVQLLVHIKNHQVAEALVQ